MKNIPKVKTPRSYKIVYVILSVLTVLLVLVAFWLFVPYKTIEFNGEYITGKTSYIQGEETYYTVSYCKYTDAPAKITKEFVDGLVFTADSPRAVLYKGCRTAQLKLKIPDSLPPGRYHLITTVRYEVNPIRTITVTHNSNWFTVHENTSGVILKAE